MNIPRRIDVPPHAAVVSGWHLGIIVTVAACLTSGGWLLVTQTPVRDVLFDPVATRTAGLVQPTLLVYLVFTLVMLGLFRQLGLSIRAVDLSRSGLRSAVIVVTAVWVLASLVAIATSLVMTGRIPTVSSVRAGGVGTVLGLLLAQLLGNALYEEALYRGFLLTALHARFVSIGRSRPFLKALLLSQVVFALVHLPARLVDGLVGVSVLLSLSVVFLTGVGFALLYYRTGNLWLVVGIHALLNYPSVVVGSEPAAILTVALAAVGLLVAWPALEERLSPLSADPDVVPQTFRPRT